MHQVRLSNKFWINSVVAIVLIAALAGLAYLRLGLINIGPNILIADPNDFGIAKLVVQDGKAMSFFVQGLSNRESNQSISATTNFNLASMSKQFTAGTAMLLKREDMISFDSPITQFLQELPSAFSSIKIKDLIFHTSGLPDYLSICFRSSKVNNKDVLEYLLHHDQLLFQPGSQFQYSNTGYVLLSEILQRASNESFPVLIQDRIFKPLNMIQSRVRDENGRETIPESAIGYVSWPFFQKLDDVACDTVYGDGGIYTNIEDYKKWIHALEVPGFFREEELREIFHQGSLNDGTLVPYGFGWSIREVHSEKVISHSGAWTGFRTAVYYYPNQKLWSVAFSNSTALSPWDEAKKDAAPFRK